MGLGSNGGGDDKKYLIESLGELQRRQPTRSRYSPRDSQRRSNQGLQRGQLTSVGALQWHQRMRERVYNVSVVKERRRCQAGTADPKPMHERQNGQPNPIQNLLRMTINTHIPNLLSKYGTNALRYGLGISILLL